jgi:hypothetical protein
VARLIGGCPAQCGVLEPAAHLRMVARASNQEASEPAIKKQARGRRERSRTPRMSTAKNPGTRTRSRSCTHTSFTKKLQLRHHLRARRHQSNYANGRDADQRYPEASQLQQWPCARGIRAAGGFRFLDGTHLSASACAGGCGCGFEVEPPAVGWLERASVLESVAAHGRSGSNNIDLHHRSRPKAR